MKQRKRMLLFMVLLTLLVCAFPAYAKSRKKVIMTLDEVRTGVESYNPSYGDKLKITSVFTVKNVKKADKYKLVISIKNALGKTVYKKTKTFQGIKIRSKGGTIRYNLKWNGKASAGNSAKLKKNSVVPDGDYKASVMLKCVRAKGTKKPKKATGSAAFKVDNTVFYYDPVTGTVIPRYTGTPEIDYLAELMLEEAGVKLDMPEEMRVKLIYNYLTVHFRHLVDISNVKPAYNLTALSSEIAAFRKQTKKKAAAGQITISNKWSGELNHMVKRAGRCNNNSAAFCILCNHAGIKCKRIVGKVFSGKTQMNHFWNSAVVDGVTWYYDIDVEIHHYNGSGVSAFSQYRKTLAQSKKNHIYE